MTSSRHPPNYIGGNVVQFPPRVAAVVDLTEYRIQKLACGSAKPQAFVGGYVLARGVGDLISREVDQLIERGEALLRGLECRA